VNRNYKFLALITVVAVALIVGLILIASQGGKANTVAASGVAISTSTALTPVVQASINDPRDIGSPQNLTALAIRVNAATAAPSMTGIKAGKIDSAAAAKTDAVNITESDVRDYLATHPIMGIAYDASKISIDKVEFKTRKSVNEQLHGDGTSLSDNKILAFVTLSGSFTAWGAPTSFSKAFAVFDAATGNFVMSGQLVN
jgi:hypothetical protein